MTSVPKWSKEGANILAPERMEAVRAHLENVGFIVVLWSHYRAARPPTRLSFDEFEEFEQFLKSEPVPGDAIDVWRFPDDPKQRIAEGKIPNERGEVPERGPY